MTSERDDGQAADGPSQEESVEDQTDNDGQAENQKKENRSLAQKDSPSQGSQSQEGQVMPMPPSGGQPIQLALGMQLIQQTPFHQLDKDVQKEMIALAGQMDTNAYNNAQNQLDKSMALEHAKLDGGKSTIRHVLYVVAALAVAGLGVGSFITFQLLEAGQHQLAYTLMMSGFAVVSALLGGAGLTKILSGLFK